MIQFFQVLFLASAVVLLVLNILDFNKWQESRKEGSTRPYLIKWVPFILTTLVSLGCIINVIAAWIRKA